MKNSNSNKIQPSTERLVKVVKLFQEEIRLSDDQLNILVRDLGADSLMNLEYEQLLKVIIILEGLLNYVYWFDEAGHHEHYGSPFYHKFFELPYENN